MKAKQLKEIIMNLDDNYDIVVEHENEVDVLQINAVEISLAVNEVLIKVIPL